jgi:hypothetical protein
MSAEAPSSYRLETSPTLQDEHGPLTLSVKHLKHGRLSISLKAEERTLLQLQLHRSILNYKTASPTRSKGHRKTKSQRKRKDKGSSEDPLKVQDAVASDRHLSEPTKKKSSKNTKRSKKRKEKISSDTTKPAGNRFNTLHQSFPRNKPRSRPIDNDNLGASAPMLMHTTGGSKVNSIPKRSRSVISTPVKGERQKTSSKADPPSDESLSVSDLVFPPAWLKRRQKLLEAHQQHSNRRLSNRTHLSPVGKKTSGNTSKVSLDGFLVATKGAAVNRSTDGNDNDNDNDNANDEGDASSYFSSPRSIQQKRLRQQKRRLERENSLRSIRSKNPAATTTTIIGSPYSSQQSPSRQGRVLVPMLEDNEQEEGKNESDDSPVWFPGSAPAKGIQADASRTDRREKKNKLSGGKSKSKAGSGRNSNWILRLCDRFRRK